VIKSRKGTFASLHPLGRSSVTQGLRILAVTWANATRGKSASWLHAAVRRGRLAVR
jgi:hypothetical protein